jgi:hypothetical protein
MAASVGGPHKGFLNSLVKRTGFEQAALADSGASF